jgi:hypothetical protein
VEEKNALLDRYTALYRHAYELEQYAVQLGTETSELQHVLEQTLSDERRVQVSAAGLRSSLTGLGSPSPSGAAQGSTTPVRVSISWPGTILSHVGMCWVMYGRRSKQSALWWRLCAGQEGFFNTLT